ncbi:MAG: hypothetical protein GX060_03810 [Firmicutes bacterium]|nr:hypothetical protein [Bacillota bacterium]
MQGIVLTASAEFLEAAKQEVLEVFPASKLENLGDSVFWLPTETDPAYAQKQLLMRPPIFVHHMHAAARWPVHTEEEIIQSVRERLLADLPRVPPGAKVATQGRVIDKAIAWQPRQLKEMCDELLLAHGYQPQIKGPEWVISVTQAGPMVYYGLALARDNLSDWAGGMIHFRKEPGDVSRAKYKLLEAIVRFQLDFPTGGHALDLGAAPGGWTQELLARGLRVLAVDTGELDPRLRGKAGLVFRRANVKDLRFPAGTQFDVITSDISWDPFFTVSMINRLVEYLRPGGQVILTVKLMGRKPLPTVRRVMASLDPKLRVQHAQHLFHNRKEITLHLVRISE